MKTEDAYLKFVRWSEEDGLYIGFCPDLFPFGGVCHSADEEQPSVPTLPFDHGCAASQLNVS